MTTSIVASYNDAISVSFRSDAWFNATQVGRQFGKKPDNWLRNDDTKAYILAFSQMCDFEENQLVSIKRGNPEHGGGTWMHPKLGVAYARWLDPKFGVWCDLQVEKILYPHDATKSLESPTLTASEQQTLSEIVAHRAQDYGDRIGQVKAEIWSRLHRKFRVAKYNQLPREKLGEAITYVMQMEIQAKKPVLEIAPPELSAPTHNRNYAYGREQLDSLKDWARRSLQGRTQEQLLKVVEELEGTLVRGWTEMDEALFHLGITQAMLRRWRSVH